MPWIYQQQRIGWIKPDFAEHLKFFNKVFRISANQVEWITSKQRFSEKSAELDAAIKILHKKGVVQHYHNELYPIVNQDRNKPIATLDRSSAAYFGIRAFGQHINGYVKKKGKIYLWVAKRAKDKMTFAGKLDHIVAGGLPYGLSLQENLIKECGEEAGIRAELALTAKPVAAISYLAEAHNGIKPDTIYCYDIELPENFEPRPVDGEVESFRLMPVNEVMELVANSDKIKQNCNLVLIDFFIRHGLIPPDHPEYLALVKGLHR